MWILGQPRDEFMAKWSTAATFVNAIVSTAVAKVAVVYNVLVGSQKSRLTDGYRSKQEKCGSVHSFCNLRLFLHGR